MRNKLLLAMVAASVCFFCFAFDPGLRGVQVSSEPGAIRPDGTTVFSAGVSDNGYHVEPMSGISVSSDGDHFALSLDFAGAGWLWGNLDMGPEHISAYVWPLSRAKPCAKIRLRRWLGHSVFAFAPQGSWFALLDGSRLTVQPLPNHLQQ